VSVAEALALAALLVALLVFALQVLLLARAGQAREGLAGLDAAIRDAQRADPLRAELRESLLQLERALRNEVAGQAQASRTELLAGLTRFQGGMAGQQAEATRSQNQQIDALAQQLASLQTGLRDALALRLQQLSMAQDQRLADVRHVVDVRLSELRQTIETRLRELQTDNEKKLEQMRATVDEKLHATLEQRLGESFKQVAERLEQVHRGLGEMQGLAQGVGDLKALLSNVKTRGTFGEAQLGSMLEQVFAPDQYAAQVAVVPGRSDRVDFAVRLPGRSAGGETCWLPIDAKFPTEDYERLLEAQQRADPQAVEAAARGLENRLKAEARSIADKYIAAPHTTEFAFLFLPSEGLYAEALRRPGLADTLQRQHRVLLAGPTTLMALLNSLQVGFRTLALEQRSAEVWRVLSAVKTEFARFGEVLDKTRRKLDEARATIDSAEVRTRAMDRKLRQVEVLPEAEARDVLGLAEAAASVPSNAGSDDV
jgi:DNA recombination protein RmuC